MSTTCSAVVHTPPTSTSPPPSSTPTAHSTKVLSPSSSSPTSPQPNSASSFSALSSVSSSPTSSPSSENIKSIERPLETSPPSSSSASSSSIQSSNMNILSLTANTPKTNDTMILRPKSEPTPSSPPANRTEHSSVSTRSFEHDSRPSSTHSASASTDVPTRSRSPSPLNLATQTNTTNTSSSLSLSTSTPSKSVTSVANILNLGSQFLSQTTPAISKHQVTSLQTSLTANAIAAQLNAASKAPFSAQSSLSSLSLLGQVPLSNALTGSQASNNLSPPVLESANTGSTSDPSLSDQQLMYKWAQHGEQLVANIAQLINEQQIVDVTLACDGQSIRAHKLVLSAGSSYFRELFAANPCKHPIVILKDIAATELRLILHFMYQGELRVSHGQLPSLLKTAQLLQVRGLLETLKQRLLDDPINSSAMSASLHNLDSTSRPDCVVVSGHDSALTASLTSNKHSNHSTSSVFNSSLGFTNGVPVSTFGNLSASLAGLTGAFPVGNSVNFPTTNGSLSNALNGSAALLAAELNQARYAAAAFDLAALSQCRNGIASLDPCVSDADGTNVQDSTSNLLAAGSSLLLPTAFRNDLLHPRSIASSITSTATSGAANTVNDSFVANSNNANTDELLDELLSRSRKRRRGQPLSGLLRVAKSPFANSSFGQLNSGSMSNLSASLPFAALNSNRCTESPIVNGSALRTRSTGASISNGNSENTNETALSLVTSNRRSMTDLSNVPNGHDLTKNNGSTGSTGSSGASSSSNSSRNSSCPSQSVTPAMLAATGLIASNPVVATNGIKEQSLDSDGGGACSDDESPDVNALKNMRQLVHQAAAALSKQQTGALLALQQRSATPDNGSLIARRKNRRPFGNLDQLPENSENNWLQNGQIETPTIGADEDDNDELIDMRPIVSFDEGSNLVSTIGSNDQINDLNQQLINSMSSGKTQPPSGSKICICPLCHLTFTAFSSLRRHMQRHYADRERYECDICLKSYSRKDYLKEHKKLKHSNLVSGYANK